MKKIFLLMVFMFSITGCYNNVADNSEQINNLNGSSQISSSNEDYSQFISSIETQNNNSENVEFVLNTNTVNKFKKKYGVNNLASQEIYKIEDNLYINLFFNEDFELKEIKSVREFIVKTFVMKSKTVLGLSYKDILGSDTYNWNKVTSKIYIGDDLILEENYNLKNNSQNYYENIDLNIKQRTVTSKYEDVINTLKDSNSQIKDVILEESFKSGIIVLKINTDDKLDESNINTIKTLVESEVAPRFDSDSSSDLEVYMDYEGIVLQLNSNNEKYYENTYYNKDDKSWIDSNWMNNKNFVEPYGE